MAPRDESFIFEPESPSHPHSSGSQKNYQYRITVQSLARNTRRNKQVHFDFRQSLIHTIPNRSSLTVDQKDDLWYSASDYKSFREVCRLTVELLQSEEDNYKPDDVVVCSRGLERFLSPDIYNQRKGTLAMEIQVLQLKEGGMPPEDLATLFQAYTAPCTIEAITRGLEDEEEAIKYYKSQCRTRSRKYHKLKKTRGKSSSRSGRFLSRSHSKKFLQEEGLDRMRSQFYGTERLAI